MLTIRVLVLMMVVIDDLFDVGSGGDDVGVVVVVAGSEPGTIFAKFSSDFFVCLSYL